MGAWFDKFDCILKLDFVLPNFPPVYFISWWLFHLYQVFLKDTDERACAYIAGPAPNRWGFTFEGQDLFEAIDDGIPTREGDFFTKLGSFS